MTLSHFLRLYKDYKVKEDIIESMRQKDKLQMPITLGIVDDQEIKRMRREQIEEEEKQVFQIYEDEDYLRQLQNILKRRLYEENYRAPKTSGELMDVKERMEEICSLVERADLSNVKRKLDNISSEQILLTNHKLVDDLTTDIQSRFQDVFRHRFKQSIAFNSDKLANERLVKYKQSLISVQTQTPEPSKKTRLDAQIKENQNKSRIIQALTARANMYEKVMEEGVITRRQLQQEVQRGKSLCNCLATKYQEVQQQMNQNKAFAILKEADLQLQIKIREANIKKLTDILEQRGMKFAKNSVGTETEVVLRADKGTEAVFQDPVEKEFLKVLEYHLKSKQTKRFSSINKGPSALLKIAVEKKRCSITQHVVKFMEYMSSQHPGQLFEFVQKVDRLDYNRIRMGIGKMISSDQEDRRMYKNSSVQTDQQQGAKPSTEGGGGVVNAMVVQAQEQSGGVLGQSQQLSSAVNAKALGGPTLKQVEYGTTLVQSRDTYVGPLNEANTKRQDQISEVPLKTSGAKLGGKVNTIVKPLESTDAKSPNRIYSQTSNGVTPKVVPPNKNNNPKLLAPLKKQPPSLSMEICQTTLIQVIPQTTTEPNRELRHLTQVYQQTTPLEELQSIPRSQSARKAQSKSQTSDPKVQMHQFGCQVEVQSRTCQCTQNTTKLPHNTKKSRFKKIGVKLLPQHKSSSSNLSSEWYQRLATQQDFCGQTREEESAKYQLQQDRLDHILNLLIKKPPPNQHLSIVDQRVYKPRSKVQRNQTFQNFILPYDKSLINSKRSAIASQIQHRRLITVNFQAPESRKWKQNTRTQTGHRFSQTRI